MIYIDMCVLHIKPESSRSADGWVLPVAFMNSDAK